MAACVVWGQLDSAQPSRIKADAGRKAWGWGVHGMQSQLTYSVLQYKAQMNTKCCYIPLHHTYHSLAGWGTL